MNTKELKSWKETVDGMSQIEMARCYRFSPSGHPIWANDMLSEHFMKRFKELGGMTPSISKEIGLGGW